MVTYLELLRADFPPRRVGLVAERLRERATRLVGLSGSRSIALSLGESRRR